MNKYKLYERICLSATILLSNIMCIKVSYIYCTIQWAGKYEGWSAPPTVAFLYAAPFVIGIIFFITLSWIFHKRAACTKGNDGRIP